jgi:uncharacterized membrane protein
VLPYLTMTPVYTVAALLLLVSAGCRPGPIVGGTPTAADSGTIAGIVSTSANMPVQGRTVTAINTVTGQRFQATTAVNGGYTIQVPLGRYRLEIELHQGERLAQEPGETRVNRSDLDPSRNFVITAPGTRPPV